MTVDRAGARDPLRVGLLGCGVVGSAVARALLSGSGPPVGRFQLAAVAVRHPERHRDCPLDGVDVGDDAAAVALREDVDVVVEATGDAERSGRWLEAAMDAGRDVVTANKALVAAHGHDLERRAAAAGVGFGYEAAVGGAVPVVATLRRLRDADEVLAVEGVLNGTANFVLDAMAERGWSQVRAVDEARALGYAEADPTRDLDGTDSADKLVILARLAWGGACVTTDVEREGLEGIGPPEIDAAARQGKVWRLVAEATAQGALRVGPRMLPVTHPLARAKGVGNVVRLSARRAGTLTLTGSGAGGDATASAVLADLCELRTAVPASVGRLRRAPRLGSSPPA